MNMDEINHWRERFLTYLDESWATGDGAHDVHHLHRVWARCVKLREAEQSGADLLVLLAGAYFHDLISLPKDHEARHTSSLLSAEMAVKLLRSEFAGFPEEKIAEVYHVIHAHSFSAAVEVESEEAAILQDADRMEALGALGVARLFYTAGRMGSAIADAEDPLAERRVADDRRYAVDHIALKLLRLPETMKTPSGKRMAQREAEYIREFRDKLLGELRGE